MLLLRVRVCLSQAIVEAMPAVLEENDKVKLVIVGDGPYAEDLKELVAKFQIEEAVAQEYYKLASFRSQ